MAILGKPFDPDNAARILSPFSASSPSNSVLGQSRALGAPFVRRPRGGIPKVPIAPGNASQRPDSPRAIDKFPVRPATPQSVLTEPARRGTGTLQAYAGSPQAYSNQLLADAFDPRETPEVREQMQTAFGLQQFFNENQTNLVRMLGATSNIHGLTAPGSGAYLPRGSVSNQILQLAQDEAQANVNSQIAAQQQGARDAEAARQAAIMATYDTGPNRNPEHRLNNAEQGSPPQEPGRSMSLATQPNWPAQLGNTQFGFSPSNPPIHGKDPIPSPSNEPSAILGGGPVGQLTPQQQAAHQDALGKVEVIKAAEPRGDLGMPEIQYLDASKGEFKNTPVAQTVLTPDKIYAEPAGAPSLSAEDIASLESAGVKYADYQNIMNTAKSSGTDTFSGAIDSLNQTMAAYKAAVASGKDSVAIAKLGRAIQQGMAGLTSAQAKYSAHQTKVAQDAAALAATNQRDPTQVTQ